MEMVRGPCGASCARPLYLPCQLHPHYHSPMLSISPLHLRITRRVFPRFQSVGPRRARDHVTNNQDAAGGARQRENRAHAHTPRPLSCYWSERPGFRLESLRGQNGGGGTALDETPDADWSIRIRDSARMFKLPALCSLVPRPLALRVSGH